MNSIASSVTQETKGRWAGRPRVAFAIKFLAWLAPIATSVVLTHFLAKAFPRPSGLLPAISWFVVLAVVATAILWAADKVARRLLPLAALFQLSLVFPDRAPSRFRAALRTQTVHQLEEQVAEIKRNGLPDDPTLAAETLIELVAALSAHDRLTRGHAERVRAYSRMIGEEMKLPEKDVELLQWAGLLHDVGKLFTPGEILNKTSKLTDDEFDIIKLHPGQGAALVEPLRGWLGDWIDAVGQHHERWDGRGYPSGLAGEEISLAARIVSVADVYDVITSVRSYKPALTPVAGREELARCAGTQFDRDIVRAFLNISLGRMRLAMGPLSWMAQIPIVGRVPLAPVVGGGASVAATAATLLAGGVLDQAPEPPVLDAVVEAVAPAPSTTVLAPLPPPTSLVVTVPDTVAPETTVPAPSVTSPPVTSLTVTAVDDRVEITEGESIDIDVGVNDSLAGTATVVDQPSFGVVTHVAGTVFRFTSDDDSFGETTFTYSIDDGNGNTAVASVTVIVAPAPDAPVALDDLATVAEDGTVNIAVLLNDSDVDGDVLTITSVASVDGLASIDGTTIDYTPTPGTSGTHTVTYVIDDSTGLTATATVTVTVTPKPVAPPPPTTPTTTTTTPTTTTTTTTPTTTTTTPTTTTTTPPTTTTPTTTIPPPPPPPAPRAPNAVDDAGFVNEDESVNLAVLANDSDPDGDTLTIVSVSSLDGLASISGSTIDYTPTADSWGTHTIFYVVDDGTGLTDAATVTVAVNPMPDAPVAANDAAAVDEDGSVTIAVLANDTDVDGDVLTIVGASSSNGVATTDGSTIDYSPGPHTWGTHTITYQIDDGTGLTDIATVTVAVKSVPDAPVAVDDLATVDEDSSVNITVLANDGDADGDPLTVTSVSSPDGVVTTDGATVDYTPATDSNGTHSISYTVSDGSLTDTATVRVTVNAVADAPVADPDVAVVDEDTSINIVVLSNDTDADGNTLTVTSVSSPDGVVTTDGTTVDYTPAADTSGTHTVTYTIDDGTGLTDFSTITITVNPIQDPPVASDDATSLDEDTSIGVSVLANDADPDGDALTVISASSPDGVATHDGTIVTYTPAPDTNGAHTVSYTIDDGNGNTDTATISVTVNPIADAPVANDDVGVVDEDSTVNIVVLTNDTDADGDTPTVTLASSLDGVATTDGTTIDYTPAPDSNGTQSVSYTIDDGTGLTDIATVTVTVNPTPDAPIAADDAYTTDVGVTLTVPAPGVLDNDSDEDGETLTSSVVTGPTDGGLTLQLDGSFVYIPNPLFVGTDSFTYIVDDGTGLTDTATVTVTVDATRQAGFYLGTSGASASDWDLVATAAPVADPEPDHDGDLELGLSIYPAAFEDMNLSNTNPEDFQHWSRIPTTDLVLDGPVWLDLWSTTKSFQTGKPIDYSVWLQDCASDGTGCVTLASTNSVHVPDWNEGVPDWVNRTITVGSVDHTVVAGRMLRVRLMFGHRRVWVALSGSRPSQLIFTTPASGILISEFSNVGNGPTNDFVELYNSSAAPVDIEGWTLEIADDTAITQTIPLTGANTVIPPGGHYLLADSGPRDQLLSPLADSVAIRVRNGTTISDEVGTRFRSSVGTVPAALWSEGTGLPPLVDTSGLGASWERKNGGSFGNCIDTDDNSADFTKNFTPAQANPQRSSDPATPCGTPTAPTPPSTLVISEYRTDGPGGGQDEFIEIFESDECPISLLGYQLRLVGGLSSYYTYPAIVLAPGQHYLSAGVGYAGASDGLQFNFTNGSSVALYDVIGGSEVDTIEVGGAPPELPTLNGQIAQSYERKFGGCVDTDVWNDDFFLQSSSAPSTSSDPLTPC